MENRSSKMAFSHWRSKAVDVTSTALHDSSEVIAKLKKELVNTEKKLNENESTLQKKILDFKSEKKLG